MPSPVDYLNQKLTSLAVEQLQLEERNKEINTEIYLTRRKIQQHQQTCEHSFCHKDTRGGVVSMLCTYCGFEWTEEDEEN